jgi:hypothetical protein
MRRVGRIIVVTLLLAIAGYVIWGRVEAVRFSRAVAAIQARGEPVDYAYWYSRQTAAEHREAAALYAQAAELATEAESGQPYRAWQIDVDKPGGPVLSLPEIAANFRHDAPAMHVLDRVTSLEFTEFGEDNQEFYANQIPLQTLGAQACLRADLVAAAGDDDRAAAALIPCVRLQRTLTLPNYRSQHAGRLLGSFRILFRHASPSEASLAELQQAFDTWPDQDAAVRGVMQRRVAYLGPLNAPRRGLLEGVLAGVTQPIWTNIARRQLDSFDEGLAVARLPWPERWEAIERRAPLSSKRGLLESLMRPPSLPLWSFTSAAVDLAARRIMTAVLAIERFRHAHSGVPPPSLEALVPAFLPAVPQDPFSSDPLVYRKDAERYVVYSLDSNRRDDGGALYGHGAAITQHVGPHSPRDLGIQVEMARLPKR